MIIDGMTPDPRRRESTRITVQGRLAWTVPNQVVSELGLRAGERLPAGAADRLDAAAEEEGAVRAALRLLERRAHSRAELERKLSRRGHSDAAGEAALRRLERLGLIDDVAFAEQYVVARAAQGRGPARLRRDLGALGIDSGVVSATLERCLTSGEVDPWQRTLAQAERRAAAMRELPPLTRQRRLAAFFARRGFTDQRTREALERLTA